jgi:hypothetical protein
VIDKRIRFKGGGMDMGNTTSQARSASMANTPSRTTSTDTGGSSGNLGGGGGGQNSAYRSYSPPTKKTYTSKTIDSKPITGDDYRRSQNDWINSVNTNNLMRANQTNTTFTPYQGGARNTSYYKPNPLGGLLKLASGIAIPGANFFLNQGSKLKDGILSLNDKIQNSDFGRSTSLMDYLDMKKFGGYDEREMTRRINLDEAKLLQDRIDAGEFDGFEKPTQTFNFDNSGMQSTDLNNIESLVTASQMPQSTFEGYTFDDRVGSSNRYIVPFEGARTIVPNPNFTGELGYEQPNIEFGGTVLEDEFSGQPQEGIMGIDVGQDDVAFENDLMAKVSAQDLARYSQLGDLTRATDYETAMDTIYSGSQMTPYEYDQLQKGNITQPGTYIG